MIKDAILHPAATRIHRKILFLQSYLELVMISFYDFAPVDCLVISATISQKRERKVKMILDCLSPLKL